MSRALRVAVTWTGSRPASASPALHLSPILSAIVRVAWSLDLEDEAHSTSVKFQGARESRQALLLSYIDRTRSSDDAGAF